MTEYLILTQLFLFYIISVAINFNCNKKIISYLPDVIQQLGILGTFIGIMTGLSNYTNSNLDSVINNLMGGLSTAFLTTITGIVLSILATIVCKLSFEGKEDE